MKNSLKKFIVVVALILGIAVTCACATPPAGPTTTPTPTTIESITIATPLTKIVKGMDRDELFSTFTYTVGYSNGTSQTYTSANQQWASRLTCTPEYDATRSGVSYVFSLTFAGITSNQITLSVDAEPVGIELTTADDVVPCGISEAAFIELLSVDLLMSDGSKVPYTGQVDYTYTPAFDTSVADTQFSVCATAEGFTSNSLTISVAAAELVGIEISSDFSGGVPQMLPYDDFLSSVQVFAVYSNDARITLPKSDYEWTMTAFDSETPGASFDFSASHGGFDVTKTFTVFSEPSLTAIELENTNTLTVVSGSTIDDVAELIGAVTYVYGDESRVVVANPVLKFYVDGQPVDDLVLADGASVSVGAVAGAVESQKVDLVVVSSAELSAFPTELPLGATLDDVKKFVKLTCDETVVPTSSFELTSSNLNTSVLGVRSDFVVKYANSTFTFSATTVEFSLQLVIDNNVILYGTPVDEIAKYFTLTKVYADGTPDQVVDHFAVETNYTPTATNGTYNFKVTFGDISSNTVNAELLIEFDSFTFRGEDGSEQLVFPYGTTFNTIKEALDIYLTLDGVPIGEELSKNSPLVSYSPHQAYLGRNGSAFEYKLKITISDESKITTIYIEGEDPEFLGTHAEFIEGEFVKTPVSGTLQRAPTAAATEYYYAIKGIPSAVYTTRPIVGAENRYVDARTSQDKYLQYLGYYINYVNGYSNPNVNIPESAGMVEYSTTFYHSLCGSTTESSTRFTARIKLTVEKINHAGITVEEVIAEVFDSESFIESYLTNMKPVHFTTSFVYTDVSGELAVGDEIWIDISGDEANLIPRG